MAMGKVNCNTAMLIQVVMPSQYRYTLLPLKFLVLPCESFVC